MDKRTASSTSSTHGANNDDRRGPLAAQLRLVNKSDVTLRFVRQLYKDEAPLRFDRFPTEIPPGEEVVLQSFYPRGHRPEGPETILGQSLLMSGFAIYELEENRIALGFNFRSREYMELGGVCLASSNSSGDASGQRAVDTAVHSTRTWMLVIPDKANAYTVSFVCMAHSLDDPLQLGPPSCITFRRMSLLGGQQYCVYPNLC